MYMESYSMFSLFLVSLTQNNFSRFIHVIQEINLYKKVIQKKHTLHLKKFLIL